MSKVIRSDFGVLFLMSALFLWAYDHLLPAEDAVILFDYSKNLVQKGLITYSTQTTPIEGATDFLWMLLIAVGSYFKISEYTSALCLSFIGVYGLFLILRRRGISTPLYILALLLTPYFYAALAGFSALFFSFCYLLSLYSIQIKHRYTEASLLLLCLLRPDGVVWAAGLLLYRFLHQKEVFLGRIFFHFVLPYLLYWGWRIWYFDEWWPLPFIVKGLSYHEPSFFYSYSLICILLIAQPLFLSIFFFSDKKALAKGACALFIIPCIFYGMMRLEQNVGNRLLAPLFWGWLFCIGPRLSWRKIGVLSFVLLSVAYSSLITWYTIASLLKSDAMNVYVLAQKIDQIPRGRMLVSEAGRLAYYTHWDVEDSWGLNTPFYAHHFVSNDDLVREHYDLIVTHCDLTLLSDSTLYPYFSEKTWGHQSQILLSYLHASDYEIYLVPYYWPISKKTSLGCMRYDVYGISKSFQYHDALRQLLKERGGLLYSPALTLHEDTVCT